MVVLKDAESTTPLSVQLEPELQKQVEWFIQRMMQSLSKKVGETVSLICGHALTISVLDSLPGAALSWFLNDDSLEMDPSRILYNKGNIDITDLTPGDSGVYTCLVEWGPEKARDNITVGVYSLVVTADNPTRYVFESDGMQLFCNSLPLGELFPTATRQWFYNGTNVTIPMPTLALNESADVVPRVTKSMAGVWECHVEDVATSRVWTTSWYRLGVQDAPSFVARIYRTLADHVYVVIVASSVIVVLLCLCFIFAVKTMKSKEDETDEEFLQTRNGWENTFSQFGSGGKVKIKESNLPPKKKDKVEGGTEEAVAGVAIGESSLDNKENEAASKVNLLGEDGGDDEDTHVDKDKGDNIGDEDDNDGEESDTNKSAILSQRKAKRRRRHKDKRQSKDKRRNADLIDNNENISNIQRPATVGDAMAIKLTAKPEHRRREDGKRKKRKHRIIYPELSKDSALKWLMQNSPQLRKFQSILRDTYNTRTTVQARNEKLVGSMEVGQQMHRECMNRASASTSSNAQAHLWRMPEFRPADVKTWLARGRERVSGWSAKPSSWGHGDIRYTVLPQADDEEFMDF